VVRASAGRCRCASRGCECGGGACGSRDGNRVRGVADQTRSAPRRGEGQRRHVPGCRMVPWLPCRAPGALPAQASADGLLPDGVPDARRSPLRRGCARNEVPHWTARRCDGRPVRLPHARWSRAGAPVGALTGTRHVQHVGGAIAALRRLMRDADPRLTEAGRQDDGAVRRALHPRSDDRRRRGGRA
jgi:hypothetical protein